MGKKSKAKASKSAEKPGALATAGTPASNGTGGSSSKKQRCVICLTLLKDLTKAHECHGCHQLLGGLFCWRCERKYFKECPNGSACAHPLKRCHGCSSGITARSIRCVDVEGNQHEGLSCSDLLQLCEEGSKCNVDSMPLQQCEANGCLVQECYRCVAAPNNGKMWSCSVCSGIRCFDCMEKDCYDSVIPMKFPELLGSAGKTLSKSIVVEAAAIMRKQQPKTLALCSGCGIGYCLSCMDDTGIQIMARSFLNGLRNGVDKCEQFQCSRCYWSSKPCTNPNCPNEVGIPTKRCGGCHLDRYCSVECQAAMYPDHVGRCKKISEKRTAAGKE